jgi:hypothetical protein
MAITMVLLGSVLGLASGLASLFVLDLGVLASLAIWSGTGIATLVLAMLFALIPGGRPTHPGEARVA